VRPAQQGQPQRVGILLDHRGGDLLRRLVQAGVDDLETVVPKGPRDHLGAPIVAVEAGLCDHDAVRAVHGAKA